MSEKKAPQTAQEANTEAIEALTRLAAALAELDEKGFSDAASNFVTGQGGRTGYGLPLSHFRELPEDVEGAYRMLEDGSNLVKATSTKYTLVGKISADDGSKLAGELRQGAELMATGALVLHTPSVGCARSTRYHAKRAARSVVATLTALLQAFLDGSALEENIGAQKTGAVWASCDAVMKVPRGNRASMRRDLLTWAKECNETMEEFQEVINLGPCSRATREDAESGSVNEWDDFCEGAGSGEQYTRAEINVAKACIALIKCSRGTVGLALKACECAGEEVTIFTAGDGKDDDNVERKKAVLQWISDVHEHARKVGDGVTDLGTLLYPPLEIDVDQTKHQNVFKSSALGKQIALQRDSLEGVMGMVLDARPSSGDIIQMSEDVTAMATKLRAALQSRSKEAEVALSDALGFATHKR